MTSRSPDPYLINALYGVALRFARSDEAATTVEYGLMSALVAAATIPALSSLGDGVEATIEAVNTALDEGGTPPMAAPGGGGGGGGPPAPPAPGK